MRFKSPMEYGASGDKVSFAPSSNKASTLSGATTMGAVGAGIGSLFQNGAELIKVQKANDERTILNFENKTYKQYSKLSEELEKTGDYKGVLDSWKSYIKTVSTETSGKLSFLGKKAFNVSENTAVIKFDGLLEQDALGLQKKDLTAAIELNIQSLVESALKEGMPNKDDVLHIKADVDTLPGLGPKEQLLAANTKIKDYYYRVAEQLISSDPEKFIKNINEFQPGVLASDLANFKDAAYGGIIKDRNLKEQYNKDAVSALSIQSKDQITSILTTGKPVNPDMIESLYELGATEQSQALAYQERIAFEMYPKLSQLDALPLLRQQDVIKNIGPSPGEKGFELKQTLLESASKALDLKVKKFKEDPVAALEEQVQMVVSKSKANPVAAMVEAQKNQGVASEDIQFFTNKIKEDFKDQWEKEISSPSNVINQLLDDIPEEYKKAALATLPIDQLSNMAYNLSEVDNDRNLMINAVKLDVYTKVFSQEQKDEVNELINNMLDSDDSPLNYYKNLLKSTGDADMSNYVPQLLQITKRVGAYHYMTYNDASNTEVATVQTMFGQDNGFVSNDLILGSAGSETLELLQTWEGKVLLTNLRATMPSFSYGLNEATVNRIRQNDGKWIIEENKLVLFDPITRTKVVGEDGMGISIDIGEFKQMVLQAQSQAEQLRANQKGRLSEYGDFSWKYPTSKGDNQ